MDLSVVIPAYRQEETIIEDVRRIDVALRASGLSYELLVVVDGFVDGTYERAVSIESDRVKILGYGQNGGKGHAVRFGMRHAHGDLVAFLDAGMDLDPGGLFDAVRRLREVGANIAIGSKRHPDSLVQYPPLRRLYSVVYQSLVWCLFGLNVRDTQVGLKVFERRVVDEVLPLLLVKRFAFDVEMLVVAHQLGYGRIVESPIALTHGKFPSTIRVSSIFHMLWDTAAVFYRANVLRYYERLARKLRAETAAHVPPSAVSTLDQAALAPEQS